MSERRKGRFRRIVEASQDYIKEVDLDGVVVYMNAHGLRTLARPKHEVIGRRWTDFWPAAMQLKIQRAIDAARQGVTHQFIGHGEVADGRTRWWQTVVTPLHDEAGTVQSLLAVSRDITERVQLDEALATINKGLERRLISARDARDRATARGELLSFQLDQAAVSNDAQRAAGEALRERLDRITAYNALLSDELDRVHQEGERQRREGEAIQEQLDVAHAARRIAEESARQAQKGEAIGQLLAGVAHDFNNMLQTAVIGLSSVLDQPDRLAPDQARLLGFSAEAMHHAATLSRRLLAFARQHRFEAEPIDLRETVLGMVGLIEHTLGPDLVIQTEAGDTPLPAFTERHSVEQAFMNLCINARDASAREGVIEVRFGTRTVQEAAATALRAGGDYVTVSVTDHGCGMDAETQARLFEPYFTTKPEGKGTGLGLAQVYGLMRQAGGYVDVVSAPGEGTTMTLAFPRMTTLVESATA